MAARRDPVDRVVDLVVATPICAYVAARRALPVLSHAVQRRLASGPPLDHLPGPGVGTTDVVEVLAGAVPEVETDAATAVEAVPIVDRLPIDGYDHLAARQVVDRLAALRDDELDRVDEYERAHRHRQTILRRIEQLRS